MTVVGASDGAPVGPAITGLNRVSALAFRSGGLFLVIGSVDGASLYDVSTGLRVRTIESDQFPRDLAVSADGKTLAVAGLNLSFYDFNEGPLLNTSGQTGFIWDGMFASDGRRLEFPGVGGPTQIWDATQGTRLRLVDRSTVLGNQGSVIFTPADQLFTMFNATGTTLDIDQGTVTSTVTFATKSQYDTITGALFTPDGHTLIGYADSQIAGEVRFWDAATGAVVRTLQAHGTNVTALALSHAGDILATAGYEQPAPEGGIVPLGNEIKLWDVAQGTLLATLDGHTNVINGVAFSPDGSALISGDQDGLVRLWSVPGGQPIRDFASGTIPTGGATFNSFGSSVAFSPDGTRVAAAGVDWTITAGHTGVIAIWSVADGSLVGRLLSPADANLGRIVWSSDGGLMAAGSADGMRVWCLDELNRI